jgi:hypothetical protein
MDDAHQPDGAGAMLRRLSIHADEALHILAAAPDIQVVVTIVSWLLLR